MDNDHSPDPIERTARALTRLARARRRHLRRLDPWAEFADALALITANSIPEKKNAPGAEAERAKASPLAKKETTQCLPHKAPEIQ
jgi:hypothetical protein